ncbi:heterokaryon incompatibility protein-domain-containing protein, partial [Suillus spraguei]
MLSKLDHAPEAHVRGLRQQYIYPSQVENAIQRAVWKELEYSPLRLLNTSTGLLCDRAAQMSTFKTSAEYKELLSSTTKHSDLQTGLITDVVARYFRCVLLSHRWEETEAVLPDIQDKVVYELNGLGGIAKLQSFCKVARDAGYRWAWMDTCCIDKRSNTEVQESVNSMFVWYRHSALTIVYLSDVPPSSQPGALARRWTFQEFVAPKVVIFYQRDWSLYLGDRSPNHKESPAIMRELENATGIDARALVTFCPGMSGAREKLQWASKRVTTLQEDVAYSLFGIFGITLPVIYGERKQNALGRLLQEIVARSGDITVLDWIGQPSEFNSCLPAHITSYTIPPRTLAYLSEDDIHTQVSSLRQTMHTNRASEFYEQLEQLSAPRFANCRLHLPCISFRVMEVGRSRGLAQDTYYMKAEGLNDLLITTKEPLPLFSCARPSRRTLLLAPDLAEQPDFMDDTESTGNWRESESAVDDSQL